MAELLFLKHFIERCEEELNIPQGAMWEMPKEDDWTFVIKMAAILEMSLNNLICKDMNDKKSNNLVYELALGKKIQYAYERELIDQSTKLKFKFIAEVRNLAAHSVMFSFKTVFLRKEVIRDYLGKFKDTWTDPVSLGENKISRKKFLSENPKLTIFLEVAEKLSSSEIDIEINKIKRNREQLQASRVFFRNSTNKES